ncbi:MAG: flagellar hook assembly protein FlgD [Planctomycetota bacterium]|jgi:flagellar basal-body rod modification protein FlgD
MSTFGGVGSARDIQSDYLKLLTTQLSNQNPMEPMDNDEMASQLAQLSQLEQIEIISSNFKTLLADQQKGHAAAMIGRQVTFYAEGETSPRTGEVQSVDLTGDEPQLAVDGYLVPVDGILNISQ